MTTHGERAASAPRIMLVAGEASGDLHGATLCRALLAQAPGCRVMGMGGRRMAEAGVDLLADVTGAAVVGGSEAVGRLPVLWRTWRRLAAALASRPPDVLVLIDFPEFNLLLARVARRHGIPVVYFIPPQVWAWRRGRLRTIRRLVSLVLAILPFEPPVYRQAGIRVEFVGHPVLDALVHVPSRAAARRQLGLGEDDLVLGLLPGSRRQEVERTLPLMRTAAARVRAAWPRARFLLGLAPGIDPPRAARPAAGGPEIRAVTEGAHAVMRAADLLLVTSGTATLEAALLGTPMVVCYRLSRASELLGRLLVRVPWISLANITLGRSVVPELFLRRDATGERLAAEALRLLGDAGARQTQRDAFEELATQLGGPGVGDRAARLVLDVAGSRWAAQPA